jgi:hypothetical protein
LIPSSIVVAPTLVKLSAAVSAHSDSFVAYDDYFGYLGGGGSSSASATSQTADWPEPASAPPSHAPAAQPARIAWASTASEKSDAHGDAVGPAWLEDFLVHMGQDDAVRNPNAGIRVRPAGGK